MINGTVFDSSDLRGDKTVTFRPKDVLVLEISYHVDVVRVGVEDRQVRTYTRLGSLCDLDPGAEG